MSDSHNKKLLEAILKGDKIKVEQFRKAVNDSQSESSIQMACVQWFAWKYPKLFSEGALFHIVNEGKRSLREGRQKKNEGMVKGVADMCLAIPSKGYGALYIEFKKKGGYQTPEQKAWGKYCIEHGNLYVVCRSLEEFQQIIEDYLS